MFSSNDVILGLLNFMGLLIVVSQQNVVTLVNKKNFVEHVNIMDCKPGKKEIRLRTGASIVFYYNETERINSMTKNEDLFCHYELELARVSRKKYGFHVYIEEMYLSGQRGACVDYIQFARDKGFITTHSSQKFCGHRSDISNISQISGASKQIKDGGPRMYVEKEDGEMDVYFQISSKSTRPRHLKMTVTVFKKNCDWADESYKPCSHSSYCVKKDFFCDGRVNCAFPHGDVGGTDEVNCNLEAGDEGSSTNHIFNIIIVALVSGVVLCGSIFCVCLCRNEMIERKAVVQSPQSRNLGIELNENTNQRNNTRNSRPSHRNDIRNSRPNQRNDTRNVRPNSTEAQPVPPDDPPSYESAIEENPGLLSLRVLPIAPPSYTESISEIQRQPLTATEGPS